MSLRLLADSIIADTEQLRDRSRFLRDLQEYSQLREDVDEVADRLEAVTRLLALLNSASISFDVTPPPLSAIEKLQALTNGDGIIEAPAATAKGPLKELEAWSRASTAAATGGYQTWLDAVLPDLDGAEAMATRLAKLDPRGATTIRSAVARSRALRHGVPETVDGIREVKELSKQMTEATEAFAPTEEVRQFVQAVLGQGAPLELLTDEVRAWAAERGILASLRVRLGGESGG